MAWGSSITNRDYAYPLGAWNLAGQTVNEAIERARRAQAEGKTTSQIVQEEVARQTQSYLFNKARELNMKILTKTNADPQAKGDIVTNNKKYIIIGAIAVGALFLFK